MIQFYSPDIKESLALGPDESAHCARVLRKRPGDRINVTDGKGNLYNCEIKEADPKRVTLEILGTSSRESRRPYTVTLAVAPTKNNDRMAWMVEKCTEIGVDRIVFFKSRHSERKEIRIDRLRRNAISAMNQSLKTFLPEIIWEESPEALLRTEGEKYFGYCDDETPRAEFVKEYKAGKDVTIAIGPEGDFSPEEVKTLTESGFRAVTFGEERLRTETAAIYGVTAVTIINEIN